MVEDVSETTTAKLELLARPTLADLARVIVLSVSLKITLGAEFSGPLRQQLALHLEATKHQHQHLVPVEEAFSGRTSLLVATCLERLQVLVLPVAFLVPQTIQGVDSVQRIMQTLVSAAEEAFLGSRITNNSNQSRSLVAAMQVLQGDLALGTLAPVLAAASLAILNRILSVNHSNRIKILSVVSVSLKIKTILPQHLADLVSHSSRSKSLVGFLEISRAQILPADFLGA